MPTYVYKFVKTGETIEVQQSFTDEPLTQARNPRTGRTMAVKKVFTPVGVTFRGDGFYKTDSRSSSKKSSSSSDTTSSSSESSTSDSGSSKSDTPSKASKSDTSSKASTPAATD
ncbi:FmdB family zinc ribbon protein [Desertimonas flava]|uniref:FmdB family zinc ribbon protein n=1 Tax=Desertimonas flava TaxID=2064846 RepID=UPI000E34ADC3|nr:FmdB family transcriptional regulator [Desertimonas flava]